MCQFDVTSVCANFVRSVNSSVLIKRFYIHVCNIKKKTNWCSMQEKARFFKSSWCYSRFLIHFSIRKKVSYFVFKDSSSPVKACCFNPLSPDQLTLYRRPNPIKIWPIYAVPPTTTLYPRSTYDLWRAGSSPTIFQPVEKLILLTTTSQSGPDHYPLYFRPTYALPDQGPLIADPSIFPERERAGVDRVSGVNGP